MEEKYLMRESRPEDIQMIAELKSLITERDQVIKKLIVRYFVFSTTVLVINRQWGSVFE
jgi:hypothetical protein